MHVEASFWPTPYIFHTNTGCVPSECPRGRNPKPLRRPLPYSNRPEPNGHGESEICGPRTKTFYKVHNFSLTESKAFRQLNELGAPSGERAGASRSLSGLGSPGALGKSVSVLNIDEVDNAVVERVPGGSGTSQRNRGRA
jgi:hypothetical protein